MVGKIDSKQVNPGQCRSSRYVTTEVTQADQSENHGVGHGKPAHPAKQLPAANPHTYELHPAKFFHRPGCIPHFRHMRDFGIIAHLQNIDIM